MARAAEPAPLQGIHTQAGSEAKALCPGHHMYQKKDSLVPSQSLSNQTGMRLLSQPVLPGGCHNHSGIGLFSSLTASWWTASEENYGKNLQATFLCCSWLLGLPRVPP